MDPGHRSPLLDLFRRGDVERDVRLLAAEGALAPRAHEQVALLVLLIDDPDTEVAARAETTITTLPLQPLRAFLARPDVGPEIRGFFSGRGVEPAPAPGPDPDSSEPLVDTLTDLPEVDQASNESRVLSSLPVVDRIKLAIKGTREQRSQLVRDSNRLVATAVLSSPKLTESEIEAFARMANVAEEVLRIIGTNRSWLKNYAVAVALARNPKTPPGISLQLLSRLTDRDMKMLTVDRNIPEVLRMAARRQMVKNMR